jgi:CBS domain-containing protein
MHGGNGNSVVRGSFFERAAQRMGRRMASWREGREERHDQARDRRGYEPGGDFGPGGYGSYGGQRPSEEAARGGGRGWQQQREPWSPATSAPARPERPWSDRRNRWQREAITAGEIMTHQLRCARPDTTLQEVAVIMRDENIGVVPVVEAGGRLVGMVTDRDLVVRAAATGKPLAEMSAGEVMTDDIEAVTPDEQVRDVIELMGERQIRRIPVVDRDDRLLGIISMGDVASRADYDEELQEALERVSSKRSFWARL